MTPRKHADLIKAWADGAEIQYFDCCGQWTDIEFPSWNYGSKYRLKPVPKEDFERHVCTYISNGLKDVFIHLHVTFDGETGEAKKVEIVK